MFMIAARQSRFSPAGPISLISILRSPSSARVAAGWHLAQQVVQPDRAPAQVGAVELIRLLVDFPGAVGQVDLEDLARVPERHLALPSPVPSSRLQVPRRSPVAPRNSELA